MQLKIALSYFGSFWLVLVSVLSTSCARHHQRPPPFANRIVNGFKASLREFPFMAFLKLFDPINGERLCGGTILDKEHILTAAHCVTVNRTVSVAGQQLVKLGCRRWGKSCASSVRVAKIMVHPDWDRPSKNNDIAILKLENDKIDHEHEVGGNLASSVVLASDEESSCCDTGKTTLTAVGWGFISSNGTFPAGLMKTHVESMPLERCKRNYEDHPHGINEKKICIVASWTSPCLGDSGGPLLKYRPNGTPVQVGIASASDTGCSSQLGAHFVKVFAYRDWIRQCVRDGSCRTI